MSHDDYDDYDDHANHGGALPNERSDAKPSTVGRNRLKGRRVAVAFVAILAIISAAYVVARQVERNRGQWQVEMAAQLATARALQREAAAVDPEGRAIEQIVRDADALAIRARETRARIETAPDYGPTDAVKVRTELLAYLRCIEAYLRHTLAWLDHVREANQAARVADMYWDESEVARENANKSGIREVFDVYSAQFHDCRRKYALESQRKAEHVSEADHQLKLRHMMKDSFEKLERSLLAKLRNAGKYSLP